MPRPTTCYLPTANDPEIVCGGDVQVAYVKKGTPQRWIRVGRMCLRCRVFEAWNWTGLALADQLMRPELKA